MLFRSTIENGRAKLRKKRVDAVVVNDISNPAIGFESDSNEVTILTESEEIVVPNAAKSKIAHRILDAVLKLKMLSGRAAPAR